MAFPEIVTDPVSVIACALGLFIVIYGFFSLFVKERLYLSETLVATVFGIIIGPYVLKFVNPHDWTANTGELTIQFARIVIAIQVMAAGVNLPKKYMQTEWISMFIILGPVILVMWFISAAFICLFFPLTFLESLVIGAAVAPTDPVLANSIVQGKFAEKYLSHHVRNVLSAESGANDGLGFPYLALAILLLKPSTNVGSSIARWVYEVWLYQILLAVIVGIAIGWSARKILRWSESKDFIDKENFLSFSIALALFIMGLVKIIGANDFIAVFAAGNAFTWNDWYSDQSTDSHLQEIIDMLFSISFFVYFGTTLQFAAFQEIGLGRLFAASACILLFRRLPIIMILWKWVPAIKNRREAIFAGWFGPIGVGALYYADEALKELYHEDYVGNLTFDVVPVIEFIVFCSAVVHGVTVPVMKVGKHVNLTVTRTFSRGGST
ncbi:Cation/H+ exchanger, partial [Piptocephalis cylindrospora]